MLSSQQIKSLLAMSMEDLEEELRTLKIWLGGIVKNAKNVKPHVMKRRDAKAIEDIRNRLNAM